MGSLEKIYSTLQLDGFDTAKPAFDNYLGSVKSYKKNAFKGSPEMAASVEERCADFIKKWDYQRPEVIG